MRRTQVWFTQNGNTRVVKLFATDPTDTFKITGDIQYAQSKLCVAAWDNAALVEFVNGKPNRLFPITFDLDAERVAYTVSAEPEFVEPFSAIDPQGLEHIIFMDEEHQRAALAERPRLMLVA
jgi:hypothetical protein